MGDNDKLTTLVHLYEDHKALESSGSNYNYSSSSNAAGSDGAKRHSEAYAIVENHTEQLQQALAKCIKVETENGHVYSNRSYTFLDLIQSLLWALRMPTHVHEGDRLRTTTIGAVIHLLHTHNVPSSLSSSVVSVLRQEIHNICLTDIPTIVAHVLNGIRLHKQRLPDGLAIFHTIELLPQLLLRISASPTVTLDTTNETMAGMEYRQRVLTQLMTMSWPPLFFLSVLKSFRDMTLEPSEERLLSAHIYRHVHQAKQVESTLFPTIFQSVLQLIVRLQTPLYRRLLMNLLLDHSPSSLDQQSDRQIRIIQSTILYHIDSMLKQWESIGKLILLEYEQRSEALQQFDIAILLMIATHTAFQSAVRQFLVRYLVDTYTTSDHGKRRKVFIHHIQHSVDSTYRLLSQQMVVLGFQLLNHHEATVPDQPWKGFAQRLIRCCFQYHESVRENLLDRLVNLIIVQDTHVLVWIELLKRLIQHHVTEFTSRHHTNQMEQRLRECIEYMIHMKEENADALLRALSPLIQRDTRLNNFVVLCLRKAMFRKDETSRIIAIQGLVRLLCLCSHSFTHQGSVSQLFSQNEMTQEAIVSQTQGPTPSMMAEDLYRQFCGIFRRTLQLQTRVRVVLYAELVNVFFQCRALRSPILEFLFQHVSKYYESNETLQPPLQLDRSLIIKRGIYPEPLAYLLHTLLHCVWTMHQDEKLRDIEEEDETVMMPVLTQTTREEPQVYDQVMDMVRVLMERMKRCELMDFEFDKQTSFEDESNRQIGTLVMEIIQVCMDWSITSDKIQASTWTSLLHYTSLYTWIERRMQKTSDTKHGGDKSKKRKLLSTKPHQETAVTTTLTNGDVYQRYVSAFEWTTLLTPFSILRVLEYAALRAKETESLTHEEEELVLICLEKAKTILDLIQTEAHMERRSSHEEFIGQFVVLLLQLLRLYSHRVEGTTKTKRDMEQARQHERQRTILATSWDELACIVELWAFSKHDDKDVFAEKLMRVMFSSLVKQDEENESEDVLDSLEDGLSRAAHMLETMIEDLVGRSLLEEAMRGLDILKLAWFRLSESILPQHLEKLQQFIVTVGTQHSSAGQRLLERMIHLLLSPHPSIITALHKTKAESLAQALMNVANGTVEQVGEFRLEQLDERNVLVIAGAILSRIEENMSWLEGCVRVYVATQRRHPVSTIKDDDMQVLQKLEEEMGGPLLDHRRTDRTEGLDPLKELCQTVFHLAGVILPFLKMDLGRESAYMRVVRVIVRLYKVLVLLVNDKVRRKDICISSSLRKLFQRTAAELSPAVLEYISCHTDELVKNKKRTRGSNHSKLIPDAIFQLEQYDVVLIKLSKLCRGVDFSAWCRLRQSRDFRIHRGKMEKQMGEQRMNEQEEEEEVEATAPADDTTPVMEECSDGDTASEAEDACEL